VIEPESSVGFLGRTVEMPYVMADGKSVVDCLHSTVEATIVAVATLLELGQKPPSPATQAKRDRQVNIRLTADEKARLEEVARAEGFRSLSDFMRHSALRTA
jgi:predicted RNase H-like HicB family nuclease